MSYHECGDIVIGKPITSNVYGITTNKVFCVVVSKKPFHVETVCRTDGRKMDHEKFSVNSDIFHGIAKLM